MRVYDIRIGYPSLNQLCTSLNCQKKGQGNLIGQLCFVLGEVTGGVVKETWRHISCARLKLWKQAAAKPGGIRGLPGFGVLTIEQQTTVVNRVKELGLAFEQPVAIATSYASLDSGAGVGRGGWEAQGAFSSGWAATGEPQGWTWTNGEQVGAEAYGKGSDGYETYNNSGAKNQTGEEKSAATDEMLLMRMELEEKEAFARLADAEVGVAKAQAKAAEARHSVIEQKLKIARAGGVI